MHGFTFDDFHDSMKAMASIKEIQQALKDHGCDPGPVDGIIGRMTIAAIKDFQKKKNLVVDGIVGPKTLAKLFPKEEAVGIPSDVSHLPLEMPWLIEAYNLIGTKEVPGAGSNEAILGWGERLRINYSDDEIPWCGLFTAHCIGSQLPQEPMPTNPLGARNWSQFGVPCSVPQLGSIMVFWRGSPDGWQGHVGFYWAEDSTCYQILGGNQSNSVSIARLQKERLIEARWPSFAMPPQNIIRTAAIDGKLLSVNEA